eukprot:jgi/Chlat1/2368/Chrsp17S02636
MLSAAASVAVLPLRPSSGVRLTSTRTVCKRSLLGAGPRWRTAGIVMASSQAVSKEEQDKGQVPATMRAVVLDKAGPASTLRIAGDFPVPQPAAGELLIKVHAAGLNPVDYKRATWGRPESSYPHVLGLDAVLHYRHQCMTTVTMQRTNDKYTVQAGTVAAVGLGVAGWDVGDKIVSHSNLDKPHGAFAEYAINTAITSVHLPDGIAYEDAAATPCAGWTAYQALHCKMHIRQGQTVVITGAAGGVGGFAVQLASLAGCRVIATCSKANFDYVKLLGATEVIDYNEHADLPARVLELTQGVGANAWLETVSSDSAKAALKALAFAGGIVNIVGTIPVGAEDNVFPRAISVHHVFFGGGHAAPSNDARKEIAEIGQEMTSLLAKGQLKPLVGEIISLENIPEALGRIEQRHVKGKIVAKLV